MAVTSLGTLAATLVSSDGTVTKVSTSAPFQAVVQLADGAIIQLTSLPALAQALGFSSAGGVNYGFSVANTGLILSETTTGSLTNVVYGAAVTNGITLGVGGAGLQPSSAGQMGGVSSVTGALTYANPGVIGAPAVIAGFGTSISNLGTATAVNISYASQGVLGGLIGLVGNASFSAPGIVSVGGGSGGSPVVVTAGSNTSIGTISNAGTTTYTVNATGTLAGGLPAPSGGNTVTTVGTYDMALVDSTGVVHYITPPNFANSIGTFPTAATTTSFHSSDLILLYQGGTVANIGSLGGLAAFVTSYQAANQPYSFLTSPGTVSHTGSFTVSGTLYNYLSTPTMQSSIDSGSFGTLAPGSTVSLTSLSVVVPALAVGNHTLQVQDQNGIKSNAVAVVVN